MTKEQIQVAEFMHKAGQRLPKAGQWTVKERKLRARLILEEALETVKALGLKVQARAFESKGKGRGFELITREDPQRFSEMGHTFEITEDCLWFWEYDTVNLIDFADGLADLHYVAYCGGGNAFGLDMEPIFQEVHRSNMSKFIDGHQDQGGKWIKGPSYSPADLAPIIAKQLV